MRYGITFVLALCLSTVSFAEKCKGTLPCDDGSSVSCETSFEGGDDQRCRIENLGGAVECAVYDLNGNPVGTPEVSICWDALDPDIEY